MHLAGHGQADTEGNEQKHADERSALRVREVFLGILERVIGRDRDEEKQQGAADESRGKFPQWQRGVCEAHALGQERQVVEREFLRVIPVLDAVAETQDAHEHDDRREHAENGLRHPKALTAGERERREDHHDVDGWQEVPERNFEGRKSRIE